MELDTTTVLGAVWRLAAAHGATVAGGTYDRADPTRWESLRCIVTFQHDPFMKYCSVQPSYDGPYPAAYELMIQDVTWGLEFEMRRLEMMPDGNPFTFGCYISRDDARRATGLGRDRDMVSRPTHPGVDFAALCNALLVQGEFGKKPSPWYEELDVLDAEGVEEWGDGFMPSPADTNVIDITRYMDR